MTVLAKLIELGYLIGKKDIIWDYQVYGPCSINDELEITVFIYFGKNYEEAHKKENIKKVIIKL
jgi:hypothetical protein